MMHNKPDSDEVQTSTYRIEISREKALEWISPRIASFQEPEARQCTATEVLDYLIERTGLLREPAGGLVDFPHRTFQEYLAACAAGGEGQEDFLAKQADDDQWHETIMLAAGTTTGGVRFGRALIDALVKRAERHKSNRPKSQRVRKTCFALALGCLENLRQQEPSLRDRVLSHLSELVPPRNEGDARILAVASDAAVPHLQYNDWKDERTSTVAACAHALRLIGTTAAIHALKRGYLSDNRGPVAAEICRTGSIRYNKVPVVVQAVESGGRLPPYIDVQDIRLAVGLKNLKHLQISAPTPKNIEAVRDLTELESVSVVRLPLADVRNFPIIRTIKSFHLGGCTGNDLSWLEEYRDLQELSLYSSTDVSDLAVTERLPNLKELTLSGVGVRTLSKLRSLDNLAKISLRRCQHISDLEPLSGLVNLRRVVIDSCSSLKEINALSLLPLTHLSIEDCFGINDLGPSGQISSLTNINLDGLRKIQTIEAIKSLGELQHVHLSRLPLLSNLSPIADLDNLCCLSVHDCKLISEMPEMKNQHNLKSITLTGLPSFYDFTSIGETRNLANLAIRYCPRLTDLEFVSELQSLRTLRIEGATRLRNIDHASCLKSLTGLILVRCSELENLPPLSALSNLERITLISCKKLTDLAPLAQLPALKHISLIDCPNVKNLAALANAPNLEEIRLREVDAKRMLIPEALLPRVQSGGILFSHPHAMRFKNDYYYSYRYHDRNDPVIVYRQGGGGELISLFSDEIDLELE
jgi:hypothetical protein